MTDKQLDDVLEELGREHRALDAPESLQGVLYAAAESRKTAVGMPRMPLAWAWAAAAILLAVVAVGGAMWWSRDTRQVQTEQVQTQQAQTKQAQAEQAQTVPAPEVSAGPLHASPVAARESVAPKAKAVREAVRARAPLRRSSSAGAAAPADAPTSSSLDAFVLLPASEGLPTAASLSIVRMRLRGSDLQQYGLQTPADTLAKTMLAEFAVGEDGLPRAIRIVR
jgi:hypothetical protein